MSISVFNFNYAPPSGEGMADFDVDFNMFSDYLLNDEDHNLPDLLLSEPYSNANANTCMQSSGNEGI